MDAAIDNALHSRFGEDAHGAYGCAFTGHERVLDGAIQDAAGDVGSD